MQLILDQYGSYLGLKSERLQVRQGRDTLQEAPLIHVDSVLLLGRGLSLSTDAIRTCAEQGIPIHILTSTGHPVATLHAATLTGTVQTRRHQLLAYTDPRGVHLAKAFAQGKCLNQAALLKYTAKYRKTAHPDLYRTLRDAAIDIQFLADEIAALEGATVDELRPQLLSREGRAAQAYWGALAQLLPAELNWPGREQRGATDPVNSALNYGYGILYTQVERALLVAGLDPYGGYVHVDRPGKPSLVLDLIEEFRQPVVDRTVIGLLNKGVAIDRDDQGRLTLDTRRRLADKILARLDTPERYEGKKHTLRSILAQQAAHIATYVRGDRPAYTPYLATW